MKKEGLIIMSKKTYAQAINEAYVEAMKKNINVFTFGEDIEFGAFQVTKGLVDKFGKSRVRNTPISESALVGAGVGVAVMGMRPVVEIQFADVLAISMDHIVNSAAKIRYLSAGKTCCPLVIRAPMGIGLNLGMHHSQCVESWFANVPGLTIACPSTPYDAKGLLLASIESNDPVLFLEHKSLYGIDGEVPDEYYTIPLGKGDIKKKGNTVTIVATSMMVNVVLEAAIILAKEGIEVEVVDPRTTKPLDKELIINSVKKTGKVVIVHESAKFGGIGGEIAAILAEEAIDYLKNPIIRVAGKEMPVPFGLEECIAPQVEDIVNVVKRIIK